MHVHHWHACACGAVRQRGPHTCALSILVLSEPARARSLQATPAGQPCDAMPCRFERKAEEVCVCVSGQVPSEDGVFYLSERSGSGSGAVAGGCPCASEPTGGVPRCRTCMRTCAPVPAVKAERQRRLTPCPGAGHATHASIWRRTSAVCSFMSVDSVSGICKPSPPVCCACSSPPSRHKPTAKLAALPHLTSKVDGAVVDDHL